MLRDAVRSFLEEDAELAWRTMATEEQGNTMRSAINAELTDLNRKGQLPAAALNPLMTIARRFERVTDQAKNLCEEVLYMCTGEFTKHKGGDAFRILFFDANNACLSQMAEGIGNSLGLPRFVFSSAGIAPQPVDARAVKFMAAKGHRPFPADQQVARTGAAMGALPGGDRPQRPGARGAARPGQEDHLPDLVSPGPGASRRARPMPRRPLSNRPTSPWNRISGNWSARFWNNHKLNQNYEPLRPIFILTQTQHGCRRGGPRPSLLQTGCGKSDSGGSGDAAKKQTIQNKGSDTMVNLAQAWAEEYKKVAPDVDVEVVRGRIGRRHRGAGQRHY